MSDFNMWRNDILNNFTSPAPTSLTYVVDGGGGRAVAIIDGVTTRSAHHQKADLVKDRQIDAYKDLRAKLMGADEDAQLHTKTAQRDLLTNIKDGTTLYNEDLKRIDCCTDGAWHSSAGLGVMKPSSFGFMYEGSQSGSAMNSTTKQWITATAGETGFDDNNLITFLSHANGDRLVVGTGGAGKYLVIFSCGHTNSGGSSATAEIHKNGSDITSIKDNQNSSATVHRYLGANGIVEVAEGDYLTLHIESATASDVISVFDCHVSMTRVS